MITIQAFDTGFTNFINTQIPHNQFFDYFFSFFSLRGNSIIIWAVLIILALILEERKNPGIQKRDILFVITFLLSFLTTSVLVSLVFKNIFQRPRPSINNQQLTINNYHCPSDFSFPSGHASTAFAAATVLTAFDKKRKWFYYGVAILISLSRIYLGCHYFLDVAVGSLIGSTISKTFISRLRRI